MLNIHNGCIVYVALLNGELIHTQHSTAMRSYCSQQPACLLGETTPYQSLTYHLLIGCVPYGLVHGCTTQVLPEALATAPPGPKHWVRFTKHLPAAYTPEPPLVQHQVHNLIPQPLVSLVLPTYTVHLRTPLPTAGTWSAKRSILDLHPDLLLLLFHPHHSHPWQS